MDLNEILIFSKVVDAGSFTAAARALDMPKSTVSRKVAELEERLGASLLQRTTRKLNLTDVGRAYHRHALRVVAELEQAELAVSRLQEAPRGLLRVTTPLNFGYFAPIVVSFMRRFPEVQVELVSSDRVVDLVEEGFDLAIRAGALADSGLIARRLGTLRSYLVAGSSFVREHGAPREPRELERFDCVVFGAGAGRAGWRLVRAGKALTVNVKARFVVNDFEFIDQAARAGLGIAMLPVHRCSEGLRTKKLARVLPEWSSPEIPFHAVYPSTRHPSPKLSAFLDHLAEQMTPAPWERGPLL